MSDAPYPPRGGKGRKGFLPTEMQGKSGILKPYGVMTGEEFMEADPKPSTMPDLRVSNPNGMDQEELGNEILGMLERTRLQEARNGTPESDEITASRAADVIMGI